MNVEDKRYNYKEVFMAYFIAHRGLSIEECENTVEAFSLAAERAYYGVECDVHVTADKKFVIFHDDTTGRVCTQDISVEGSTSARLQALEFKAGKEYKIPTLEDYLSVICPSRSRAVIELKIPIERRHIMRIIEICKSYIPLERIIFISFHLENLVAVRNLLPEQEIQLLTCSLSDEIITVLKKYRFGADADRIIVTKEIVDKLHSYGIPVNVWTCDDGEEAAKFISWGVDFITTNNLSERHFK